MPFWPLTNLLPAAKKRPSSSPPSPNPTPKRRRTTAAATTNTAINTTTPKTNPFNPPVDPSTRWNPSINPAAPEFAAVLAAFRALLRDPAETVDSILESRFSAHEQAILRPCGVADDGGGAPGNRALARIQEGNRWRYAELLRSERFRAWAGKADLAFKFTLVWFGLPVAPMGGTAAAANGRNGEGLGLRVGEEMEARGLRFLNGYTERVYERDVGIRGELPLKRVGFGNGGAHSVIEPDRVMEAYHLKGKKQEKGTASGFTTSLGLRGGKAGEQGSGTLSAAEDLSGGVGEVVDAGFGEVSLRGGAGGGILVSNIFQQLHDHEGAGNQPSRWSGTDTFTSLLHTPLIDRASQATGDQSSLYGGLSSGILQRWLPLYGYQGVVWFRIDLFHTFVDAVDRLLCLDNRAGVNYSLYAMDKCKDYTVKEERDKFLIDFTNAGLTTRARGPGDYRGDKLAWEWVVQRFGKLEDDDQAYGKALFVAAPVDPIPWTWEPEASHHVLKVVLDWVDAPEMNRPDVAYLRMPENPEDAAYTNQYGPWMTNVCRVLSAGRIRGRPGCPAVPDAWFTLKGREAGAENVGAYGGLAFPLPLWNMMVTKWKKDHTNPVTLEARSGTGSETESSGHWHLFIPGVVSPYERQYIAHDELDNVQTVRQRILELLHDSMPNTSFTEMRSLEVHLPGTGIFLHPEGDPELVIPMPFGDRVSRFQPVVDRLAHWKKWLESMPGVPPVTNGLGLFPQFLTLRPVFRKYHICDAGSGRRLSEWDPETTAVARFRRLVARAWEDARYKLPYSSDKSWISVTQGVPKPMKGAESRTIHPAQSKPSFLIGPDTTETEWREMLAMLVEPQVFVSLVDEKRLPRKSEDPSVVQAC